MLSLFRDDPFPAQFSPELGEGREAVIASIGGPVQRERYVPVPAREEPPQIATTPVATPQTVAGAEVTQVHFAQKSSGSQVAKNNFFADIISAAAPADSAAQSQPQESLFKSVHPAVYIFSAVLLAGAALNSMRTK